jgi:alkylated DNA repair dioxygenase AlkB/ubiquinone/menaquinone biosynthesis C-methylase UbiE
LTMVEESTTAVAKTANSCASDKGSGHHDENRAFRSVLPHEPLPKDELGYIHVQGGFEPKKKTNVVETADADDDNNANQRADEKIGSQTENNNDFYWSKEGLETALFRALSSVPSNSANGDNSSWSLPHGDALQSVQVLEDSSSPPFTKIRLCYSSPLIALQVVQSCRDQKLAPSHLFQAEHHHDCGSQTPSLMFASRPLQVTLLTKIPFLSTAIAWNRSNPPKFRRLLCRPGEPIEILQDERQTTRYVFMSGLVDMAKNNTNRNDQSTTKISWWDNPRNVCEAVRHKVNEFDTSGEGVEVFVSNKKMAAHFCHIGMRSPQDARALILGLQGKRVEWNLAWSDSCVETDTQQNISVPVPSDNLFLDYAGITKRSTAKAQARENGEPGFIKGEPSRSECTSTTKDVFVPGLVLIEDFISPQEEEVLMAALTGPTAPWAPSQLNYSKSGAVKRKVQHYGYVFDYETADVLRDRSLPGSDCPPLPGLPTTNNTEAATNMSNIDDMESYFQTCVLEGRGWDALACTVERTRRKTFTIPAVLGDSKTAEHEASEPKTTKQQFPHLNQVTVNFYEPGEGIGAHVDTPSAFGDGLISISLHGGLVMEFRKQGPPGEKTRKLVYLPPRSLVLMSGPARFEWEHMIVTRMTDTVEGKVLPRTLRVSLTLRTAIDLSGKPMPLVTTGKFPPVWGVDVKDSSTPLQKNALITPSTERDHVHAVYDAIATQWHHTRGKRGVLWPGATQFLSELPPASIVADIGAGDGKYFPAIWEAGSYVIGTDISLPLLQQSVYRGSEAGGSEGQPESRRVSEHRHHLRNRPAVAVADCMNVPLRTKSCDAAICIAVMHHLSTRERRIRCISELSRIVKVDGLINIQAWAMEQEEGSRRKFAGTDVFVPFNAQPKYLLAHKEKTANGHEDQETDKDTKTGTNALGGGAQSKSMAQLYSDEYNAAYDEKKGLVVFKRYCHLYRQGELEELVSEVDTVVVHESGYESGNHFVILRVIK